MRSNNRLFFSSQLANHVAAFIMLIGILAKIQDRHLGQSWSLVITVMIWGKFQTKENKPILDIAIPLHTVRREFTVSFRLNGTRAL